MTERQRDKRTNQKQQDAPGRPSQAEGDRDTIEQDLGERPDRRIEGSSDRRTQDSAPPRPSQA